MTRKQKEYLVLIEDDVQNPPKLELTDRDLAYLNYLDECCFRSGGHLK